mmetsp:Transcript_85391/g.117832  ORF Transcript_85391/g.117832 Transcript_85391/m.117832 type:complete len:114 (-) Transcript_85391:292-633(-)
MRSEGELSMTNSFIYIGAFVNDLPESNNGRLLHPTGVIFEGEFVQGQCSTVGKLLYPNGDVYFGQHRNFIKEGQGKMIYIDGTIYEGGFEHEKRFRKGRLICAKTGDIYVGEF